MLIFKPMSRRFAIYTFFVFLICTGKAAIAQTEFPKEFIAHLRLHSGLVTNRVKKAPELFVGGLQVIPQFTLVPYKLRGGIAAGAFYTGRHIYGSFGPTLSYKLIELKGGEFGSLGNLHLNIDHFWGTSKQRLAGGGVNLDLLNKLVVSFSGHRDYKLNTWWLQSGIAFRISKVAPIKQTFPN